MAKAYRTKAKVDVYQIVTDRIIKALEEGTIPWQKPWSVQGVRPANFVSKRPYHGINTFLLGMSPYTSPYWLTYKQAESIGAQVRRGEKGSIVVYWNFFESEKVMDNGEVEKKTIPFLKYFTVFNVEQCDNIEIPKNENEGKVFNPIEEAEMVVTNYSDKPKIDELLSDRAYYAPATDHIVVPKRENFDSEESFYATLFHEMIHSTGHESRLNRVFGSGFGTEQYSKEELIAEMGSAFLCNHVGILPNVEENTSSYIASWLRVLKNDKRFVVSAAGMAEKATEYILGNKEEEGEDNE